MGFVGTSRVRLGVLICSLLLGGPAPAQVRFEGIQFQTLNGTIGVGYDGQSGASPGLGQSTHGYGLSGTLNSNGFFYNPGFLSFQANTYYARADSSADSTNLSNSEGYNLGASIFGGTSFPGYVAWGQNLGQNGAYGLPGLSGLNSTDNNRNFSVAWTFRNLPVKNLSVFFADDANDTNIPGIGFTSNASSKGFGLATGGYKVAGFTLGGGYQHSLSDVTTNVSGQDGGSITGHGSSDVFHVMTSRTLPGHSNFNLSAYRLMTNASGDGESSNSDSNEFDATVSSQVWRLPLSANVSYNDNVYGSVLQQLDASGQLVNLSVAGPKIAELNTMVSSSYTLPLRIFVTGYFTHQEEFVLGQSIGASAFGGNVSYGMGKFLKGLTLTVGMHDVASQVGNTGAGLVGNANYLRNLGAWRLNANASYNQGIETVLATTTESSGSASASIRRTLENKLSFGANAGFGKSLFSTQHGQSTETKNAGLNLNWMKQTLSGYVAESSGNAIITSQGLVTVTTPGLAGSVVIPYSGKSYTAGYATTLLKNANFNAAWTRFISTGTGTGLFSNVSAQMYTGSLTYHYRKINFTANFARSKQGASSTTALPSDVTIYFFGLSRWFNFF